MSSEIRSKIQEWQSAGLRLALATVTDTWGSSPRPVGSSLLVAEDGRFWGSVSGGCVEGAVINEALDIINQGGGKVLSYGITNAMAWEVGLACGGEMRVLLRRLDFILPADNFVLVTRIHDFRQAWLSEAQAGGDFTLEKELAEKAKLHLRNDISAWSEGCFLQTYANPLRIIIIGAVHIAQILARMAKEVGFVTIVIDPRAAFITSERFPESELLNLWPDEALDELPIDSRTAIVALTHDPKLDDPALIRALNSQAFYVGALGSRKTHSARCARLGDKLDLSRIHAPIGLNIGALTPAEIAVSIMAEIVGDLRKGLR